MAVSILKWHGLYISHYCTAEKRRNCGRGQAVLHSGAERNREDRKVEDHLLPITVKRLGAVVSRVTLAQYHLTLPYNTAPHLKPVRFPTHPFYFRAICAIANALLSSPSRTLSSLSCTFVTYMVGYSLIYTCTYMWHT